MAIDSAEKRLSIMFLGRFGGLQGVTPNASPDAEWRQQMLWLYSGIALAQPVSAPDWLFELGDLRIVQSVADDLRVTRSITDDLRIVQEVD